MGGTVFEFIGRSAFQCMHNVLLLLLVVFFF